MMWEVTSYGERPYWGMSNADVSLHTRKLHLSQILFDFSDGDGHSFNFYMRQVVSVKSQ